MVVKAGALIFLLSFHVCASSVHSWRCQSNRTPVRRWWKVNRKISHVRTHAEEDEVIDEYLRRRRLQGPLQVMTDVDDTVKSSGGVAIGNVYLGGVDARFPRGVFYPGVFQFGVELSMHSCSEQNFSALPMAILTARAEELKLFLEISPKSSICQNYKKAAEKRKSVWGVGPVLYGRLREWIVQPEMANRKFDNFKKLMELNRNKKVGGYVFIGDTGLYDRQAGEMMCNYAPNHIKAVFLHDVGTREKPGSHLSTLPSDYLCNGVPIVHFRTYIGAAVKAMSLGLLSKEGLGRVAEAVERDIRKLKFITRASRNEFEMDLMTAQKYQEEDSVSELIDLVKKDIDRVKRR